MVVPVLIVSWQVSEYPNSGPTAPQTITAASASANAHGVPTAIETSCENRRNGLSGVGFFFIGNGSGSVSSRSVVPDSAIVQPLVGVPNRERVRIADVFGDLLP